MMAAKRPPNFGPHRRHNAVEERRSSAGPRGPGRSGNRERLLVVVRRGWQIVGLGAMLALGGGAAQAENLDAGKSGSALFASTCQACHSSPRGLARNRSAGLTGFLQEHYTSSPQSAALLATYLLANPGAPPRGKQTPTATAPSEGGAAAKRGDAKSEPQARAPQTATARPDSMIEPVEPRRPHTDAAKGRGKRQQTKQESPPTAAPATSAPEPAAAQPAAPPPAPAPAAPVAAAPPPPDQPAFSAPSP